MKSLGVIKVRNQTPPKNIDLRASKKDEFIEKYKEISYHPFANEIRTLFDMGFSNLSANVEAIDKYDGNLDQATNYLFESQQEEVKKILHA
jgi:hypothetical protein